MASYRKLPPADDNQSEVDQSEADDQSEAGGPRANGVAENPSAMKAILAELKEVAIELKAVNKTARELRIRKKELEEAVVDFLNKTEQTGLKFGDVVFISTDKKKRAYKKKAD